MHNKPTYDDWMTIIASVSVSVSMSMRMQNGNNMKFNISKMPEIMEICWKIVKSRLYANSFHVDSLIAFRKSDTAPDLHSMAWHGMACLQTAITICMAKSDSEFSIFNPYLKICWRAALSRLGTYVKIICFYTFCAYFLLFLSFTYPPSVHFAV